MNSNFGKQRELEHIDPFKIKLNDDRINANSSFRNARSTLNKEEMATNRESIRKLGLLKPIMVRPVDNDPDGYIYQLICGSRRLRNILRLVQDAKGILQEGRPFSPQELCYCPETAEWLPATQVYATLKCFVRECDDETAIRINIAENLEHSKVPELDLMEYCQELVDLKTTDNKNRYSREEVAEMCNRSESWVSLTLELNSLPERVKEMLVSDRLTRTGALAFLQTERNKLEEVIQVGETLVREEKMAEAQVAEEEIHLAEIDLSDAENDVEIHQMMQNANLMQIAQKRAGVARKRVSAASEKRDSALREAKAPKLTADIINKANLIVPGAKKGAPKAMPVKSIKEMHNKFLEYRKEHTAENGEVVVYNAINAVFEVILGHRPCASIEQLLAEEKEKPVAV
jgi:ParB-like chromosome segregation protein Spo0J